LLAVGGGLLLSAAFPWVGMAGAAWVAPGLILFSGVGCGGRQAFRLGFVGGLAHYLSSLYWLLAMPDTVGGIPIGPAAGWLALSAYCALFPALWVWLCWKIWPPPPGASPPTPREALAQFFSSGVLRRGRWAFNCAAIWVALEMARGRLLTGFPWNFLGVSQYKMLPLIQVAAVTGVYGVSFLVVWMSVALVIALLALTQRPQCWVWGEAGLPLLAAVAAASFGASRVANFPAAQEQLLVALAQPAFAQSLIWNENEDEARLNQMLALSEQALARPARLLIWPEGALSSLTPEHLAALAGLAVRHGVWLVVTADTAEGPAQGAAEYFNSSVLINPAGEVAGV
jgi:apolipoprotein N-acyltransferase